MKSYRTCISLLLAVIMLLGPEWPIFIHTLQAQPTSGNPPRTSVPFKPLVEQLMAVTTDTTDSDQDGLPDSVEWVIGTDPYNPDSDFDGLGDLWEINNDLDPMEPDSNFDGLPDYLEVTDVPSLDIDGDGLLNPWDFDNDGDGVNDTTDVSPSAASEPNDVFGFDITTNGNPVFITIQLKPRNPEYLKLFGRAWDWPDGDHEGAVQDWDNSKEDVSIFPILQLTLNVPPNAAEVLPNGILVEGNTALVPLIPVSEHGSIVAFAGRMPYPSGAPTQLTMEARLLWKVVGKVDRDAATLGQETLLVTYNDGFSLTGMTVEESYGTDAALFYSKDVHQTVAANLLMAYQFLRNPEHHIADLEDVLEANKVDVKHQFGSFAQRDAALVSIANDMIPEALDKMPADVNLPVVTLLEDHCSSVDLLDFESSGGGNYAIDLSAQPVMTTKSLKTSWYNTSEQKAMRTGQVMAEIKKLGQSDIATYSLMTLMLYWNTGEQSLAGAGIPPMTPGSDFELVPEIVEDIAGGGLSGLEALYRAGVGLAGLDSYRSISLLQSKGWTIAVGSKELPDLAKMGDFGKFKQWIRQSDRAQDSMSFFKKMDTVMEGLDMAALFADAGFAVYSIIAISQMSDISGIALYNSVMQVTLEYFYSCMLFLIGAIPYIGWLIAISVELSDVFGDWTEDFISWIIGAISDVDYVPTPDIEIVGDPSVTIEDKDHNGTDVGDRIEYRSRLKGIVRSSPNYWRLSRLSEIYPYYKIYGPGGSSSVTGVPYERRVFIDWEYYTLPVTASQFTSNQSEGWRAQEYESGVWIEPGIAMPNFPVYVEVNCGYELWYAWSWYSFVFWDWGWQHEESPQSGWSTLGGFTFYCDVMPGTLDDFVRWPSIGSLDDDGDGLANSEETGSNAWLYDTDGDGLNDKFEVDNGLNPKAHDTDGDALGDWYEVQFGTDPLTADTDGDGITDYLEIAGWLIQFEYAGQTFTTRVYSDPTIADTDGDGVDDYLEYWSGLNPRSKDTNGDGIADAARPQIPEGTVEFVKRVDFDVTFSGDIEDIAVDNEGSLYALIKSYNPSFAEIWKFDSDLNELLRWTYPQSTQLYGLQGHILIDSQSQLLHINHVYDSTPSIDWDDVRSNIFTVSLADGSQVGDYWATQNNIEGIWSLALERNSANGNIYVGRSGNWVHWIVVNNNYPWGIHSFMDVYDANRNYMTTWGDYAWNTEIDKFAYIQDIAYNPANGLLYIADQGKDLNKVFIGPRFRPDRIAVFTTEGQYLQDMPGYHKDGSDFVYEYLGSVDIDSDGFVYVCDEGNYRIHKFDMNGMPIVSWGGQGFGDGQFERGPIKAVVAANKDVFVLEPSYVEGDPWEHIHKFRQGAADANEPIVVVDNTPDRDGDGLLNDEETAGWTITFTDSDGLHIMEVSSDPLMADTDMDGLTDLQEKMLGTNPRDPDTDKDGQSDFAEVHAQTDPKHYDTDGDGLPDGIEATFGSNANCQDTDGDGLTDGQEVALGADPSRADTDGDGLNDAEEMALNTNLLCPDSDGDFVFDGQEVALGTNPNNCDTDKDGLIDGVEIVIFKTNPKDGDSDGDGLSDKMEIELGLNPNSEDTDNDGVPDGKEIEDGTNPWSADSDKDGIPDGQDDPNNLPPDVSKAYASREILWPANNKYVPVSIEGVVDPDGDPVQIAIVSVTSDEPASSGKGGRKNKANAYLSDDGVLYLMAERDGKGNGQVYQINFMAGDNKGGLTAGQVWVKVPHDNSKKGHNCVDDGQKYLILSFVPDQR